MQTPREFSRSEVAAHNSATDLWIIYKNKVYDLTPYYRSHPGGEAMLRRAGKDATNVLRTVDAHAIPWSFIERKLAECYVGDLKK
uniref:Cytochrome b5 heme-binding domain-containing protein n=1 Tax=Steinernema glaseri TaxID=37863 RepID=A0A1I7ZXP3_9BILA